MDLSKGEDGQLQTHQQQLHHSLGLSCLTALKLASNVLANVLSTCSCYGPADVRMFTRACCCDVLLAA
jgi:hypothetical protein